MTFHSYVLQHAFPKNGILLHIQNKITHLRKLIVPYYYVQPMLKFPPFSSKCISHLVCWNQDFITVSTLCVAMMGNCALHHYIKQSCGFLTLLVGEFTELHV